MSITINKCIGESSPVYLYCSKISRIFFIYFNFRFTYWHDRRAYVNGSFRSGSFRTWSFRPSVLSISFGGSFPPIISSHELSCSQGELIHVVYPCSGVHPSVHHFQISSRNRLANQSQI